MADTAIETAPTDENDDNWLYGDSAGEVAQDKEEATNDKPKETPEAGDGTGETEEKDQEENEGNEDQFNDEHFEDVDREEQDQANGDADSQDNGDSDSDDSDHVKVTIGEIKSGPQTYASLNVKRGVGIVTTGTGDKPRQGPAASGKVTLEDLEGPGSINGVPALEFNIDTIEDKPWNKPGADISDYFNYGFNEVTWSAYCERQRRMRVGEAGVTLHAPPRVAPPPDLRRPPVRIEDGMPPQMLNNYQARENTIQVMTAERREYGRGHARDGPEYFAPPDHFYPPPHALPHPHPPYDDPWGQPRHPEQGGWAPSEIKELTPGSAMGPPPQPPPHLAHLPPYRPLAPHAHPHPHPHAHLERERERDRDRERDRARERDERDRRDRDRREEEERDRERERERARSIKPERTRDKSYRRERSRSRSRRHKSRSRSPRPRDRSRERADRPERDRERSVKPKKDKDKDDDK